MKVCCLIMSGSLLATGFGATAAPLEAYGRLPFMEQVSLSPDGKRLAYAVTDGETRTIIIKDLVSGKPIRAVNAGQNKVRGLEWTGSSHVIVSESFTGAFPRLWIGRGEWTIAIDYDIVAGALRQIRPVSGVYARSNPSIIFGEPAVRYIDGHPVVFVRSLDNLHGGLFSLFRIDLDNEDRATLAEGFLPHTTDFLMDSHGEPLAATEYDGNLKQWTLKIWKGGWRVAMHAPANIEQPVVEGLGRDPSSVLVTFPNDEGAQIRQLDTTRETWGDPAPSPDYLIHDPVTFAWSGQIFERGDELDYEFFDPGDQKIWKAIAAAYPGDRIELQSVSADRQKYVVRVDSATEGPAFALVDLQTRKGAWIGSEYVDLGDKDISPKRSIAFKAADGLPLTGYLTLPREKPGKNLPLVVFPHGGPAARDEPGFDWWAQAMASRGYAVLQVNYRGSRGFGWAFQSAGFGQWGRKMQTDLSDGVRYLAEQGIIDPSRVCIVGGSYGGYAALAGAALDPGVYRCAASVAGPSDLERMVNDARGISWETPAERYWLRYMGRTSDLRAISPVHHAADVRIPVLLVHGKDDTVVPFEQSRIMADALRKAGKSVELVTLNNEDHWLSRGDTRLQMLQSVVSFLEKYNPPQ